MKTKVILNKSKVYFLELNFANATAVQNAYLIFDITYNKGFIFDLSQYNKLSCNNKTSS